MPIHDRAFHGAPILATGAPRHRRAHRGLAPDQEAVLDLQRLAGNSAVANAMSGRHGNVVTSVDRVEITRNGMAPAKGVEQIREKTKNKLTLALTQRSIEDSPPLFHADAPEKGPNGYTAKARAVGSIPEPKIDEYWPKPGLHKMPGGGLLDVTDKWAADLEKGEDQHRDDAMLAWKSTWKVVQDRINDFAKKPGPPEATPDAAIKALWKRYVASFKDESLRPKGAMPSDAAQRDVLAVRPGTYFAHTWETTYVRDSREYHTTTTGAAPTEGAHPAPKGADVSGVVAHQKFQVDGPNSEAFLEELRVKWRGDPGRVITGSTLGK